MTALYQNRQIRELERLAMQSGVDEYQLMCLAGQAVFDALINEWPFAKRIIVCCGKGNNGGDGLVVARLAHERGFEVEVYLLDSKSFSSSAAQALKACEQAAVRINAFPSEPTFNADVIVDALLGTGFKGKLEAPCDPIIRAINSAQCPVIAIDVPSGVDVDTGFVSGEAVKATITVTFIALKRGLFTGKAPTYCGKVILDPIGVSQTLVQKQKSDTELLSWENIHPLLPKRDRATHKGNFGHVLVIGGDYGMGGAVRMAAEAAARVGAGLVTVATRPEHVSIVSGVRPELMCHEVNGVADLEPLLERANVVVIGPGLGKTEWAISLLNRILKSNLNKVLDADSLNLLSESPRRSHDWVLTPHPGEASRLLNLCAHEIQEDRFKAIHQLNEKYGGVTVLKGVGTLIATENSPSVKVCSAGNPGMATGGMGDILSGVIGGLLAQQLPLAAAAEVGVFIHAMAGDLAASEGGERGLLATDLLPHLRSLVNPNQNDS